jgi:ABC-2 type transport system permease protein
MTSTTTGTRRRSVLGLFGLWTVQQIRQLFRNPQASFFTVVFPLLFLVLFAGLSQGAQVPVPGGKVAFAQYFTPSIATFAILSSCFTGLLIAIAMERDQLVLKRVRSTPLRPGIYIASRVAATVVMGTLTTVVLFLVGIFAFGVHVYVRMLPAAIVSFVLGAATFAALAMAVSVLVPNGDAAPAISNAVALPMTFISGVFFPMQGAPTWLVKIADVLPMLHLVNAFDRAFDPFTRGSGFDVQELIPLAIWGLAAAVFAARRFRWEPAPGRARRGGSRHRVATESGSA